MPYFPKFEFNAAYYPPGHPATAVAIKQYILLTQMYGLNTGGASNRPSTHAKWVKATADFNYDIGFLIRSATCTGLMDFSEHYHVVANDMLWPIEERARGIVFEPFGLYKIYGNTWRDPKASHCGFGYIIYKNCIRLLLLLMI